MRHTLLILLAFATTTSFSQSFYQLENTGIPDDGTDITFEMTVSGLPDVIDSDFGLESVCFNINHTWDSDLDVKLIAPDGSAFILVSGVGWGEVINGGFGLVLDGTEDAERRLKQMLFWDVNNGIARRSWARNKEAQFAIKREMERTPGLKITWANGVDENILNKLF